MQRCGPRSESSLTSPVYTEQQGCLCIVRLRCCWRMRYHWCRLNALQPFWDSQMILNPAFCQPAIDQLTLTVANRL
eukprot:3076195-Prymnesium_polylepis.2